MEREYFLSLISPSLKRVSADSSFSYMFNFERAEIIHVQIFDQSEAFTPVLKVQGTQSTTCQFKKSFFLDSYSILAYANIPGTHV